MGRPKNEPLSATEELCRLRALCSKPKRRSRSNVGEKQTSEYLRHAESKSARAAVFCRTLPEANGLSRAPLEIKPEAARFALELHSPTTPLSRQLSRQFAALIPEGECLSSLRDAPA